MLCLFKWLENPFVCSFIIDSNVCVYLILSLADVKSPGQFLFWRRLLHSAYSVPQ